MPKFENLAGRKFGRLTALYRTSRRPSAFYMCLCECGNLKEIYSGVLKNGTTRSCGCLSDESRKTAKKHGHERKGRRSPEMNTYRAMLDRCLNPKNKDFPNYGGAAPPVTVCDEWLGEYGFDNFFRDMGHRKPGTTLDRINPGPYCKDNCRWADKYVQARNRRNVKSQTINGITKTVSEWARELGISIQLVRWRVAHGMDYIQALTTPVNKRGPAI